MATTVPLTPELVDTEHCICALRIDRPEDTRGKAKSFFAREWDAEFKDVRVRKRWYRPDAEYVAEAIADGMKEPYDGWPVRECAARTAGAKPYWVLIEPEPNW